MNSKLVGFLWIVLAATCVAAATISMKLLPAVTGLTPAQVAIWRFLISAPVMWFILSIRRPKALTPPKKFWRFLLLGLIYAAASLLALLALDRLTSSLYAIIVFTYPSLVVLYSLVSRESVPHYWWLGLPLTLLGLSLTVFEFGQPLQVELAGFIITLLNGLAVGLYTILSARYFKQIKDSSSGTAWVQVGGLLGSLSLMAATGIRIPQTSIGWLMLLSLGVFGTLLPIVALNIGLPMVGAARGSVTMTLQPVLTVIFSTIFLGDILKPQQWLGGFLVVVAVILMQQTPKWAAKPYK